MTTPTILCVADESAVLQALKDQLGDSFSATHQVETAESADKALEAFERLTAAGSAVPLVIADQNPAGLRGDELLVRILARSPKTLTILLTGPAHGGASGPHRRMPRSWDRAELVSAAREALAGAVGSDVDDVLDPTALADLRRRGARNPALLQAIVAAFDGEAPALLAAMRAAAAEGSADKLRAAAHALKGAAAAVGARRLANLCIELEALGRAGGVAGAEALLAALEPQLLRACQALQAEAPRPA